MAKVTRIKASDGPRKKEPEETSERTIVRKKVSVDDKQTAKARRAKARADAQKVTETGKTTRSGKKPFILFRPFVALGHYIRDSWRELRQVRWPNRKMTWKMVLAVIPL